MTVIAMSLASVLCFLSIVHLYWTVRGAGIGAAVPTQTNGTPVFRPGRASAFLVAAALLLAAAIVLARAGVISVGFPGAVIHIGIWGVAVAFVARTVGEFRYVGLFKRVRGTPFARWDSMLFTPLCAGMSIAAVLVAIFAA